MAFGRRLLQPATFYGVRSVLVQDNNSDSRKSNKSDSAQNTSPQTLVHNILSSSPSLQQNNKNNKNTTLLTYTAYQIKEDLSGLGLTERDEMSKLPTPVVETEQGAALVKYISDPIKELESGMSSLKVAAKYLDSQSTKSISNDAEKCIALVQDIERKVDLLTQLTSNHLVQEAIEGSSPPPSRGLPEETNRASWLRCIQKLPRSAANLAKSKIKNAYNICHTRKSPKAISPLKIIKTPPGVGVQDPLDVSSSQLVSANAEVIKPVVVEETVEDPNVITVQIQHSPKKKNRVGSGGSSSRMFEMTEFDQEFVTRKLQSASDFISEVVLSPMEQGIFTPKATQCKGIITMKQPVPVHLISSTMCGKDQTTAVNIIEKLIDQAQTIDSRISSKFKSQFADTFGGTWLAQCGWLELQNNVKMIYNESVSDNETTIATTLKQPEKASWHLLSKPPVSDVNVRWRSGSRVTELGEHVCFCIEDMTFLLYRQTDKQMSKPRTLSEKTAIIKQSTMPTDMQWFAVQCARLAMAKRKEDEEFSVAEYLNSKLNDAYSPKWHCVVGPDIQEAQIYNKKENLLFLQLASVDILVWQS